MSRRNPQRGNQSVDEMRRLPRIEETIEEIDGRIARMQKTLTVYGIAISLLAIVAILSNSGGI